MTFKDLVVQQGKGPVSLLTSRSVDAIEEPLDGPAMAKDLLAWMTNQSPMMVAWFMVMAVNLLLMLFII